MFSLCLFQGSRHMDSIASTHNFRTNTEPNTNNLNYQRSSKCITLLVGTGVRWFSKTIYQLTEVSRVSRKVPSWKLDKQDAPALVPTKPVLRWRSLCLTLAMSGPQLPKRLERGTRAHKTEIKTGSGNPWVKNICCQHGIHSNPHHQYSSVVQLRLWKRKCVKYMDSSILFTILFQGLATALADEAGTAITTI